MNNNKDKNDKKDKKDFWDISKIVVTLLFTTIGGGVVGGLQPSRVINFVSKKSI